MFKIFRLQRVILIMTVTINYTNFTKVMMNLKRCHQILSTIGLKNLISFILNLKFLSRKKTETQLKKERIIKNVDELYEKYYNSYKNDYDNDDELSEAKKKN